MNAAIYIDGLDWPAGSTRGQFKPMSDRIEPLGFAPVFSTWDRPPEPSSLASYDRLFIVGHSYGGHEAIKLCYRLFPLKISGLVILDAVHQDMTPWGQFWSEDFQIPPNVVAPLSIRRSPWGIPFSRGFDQTGFNRLCQIGHAEFPKHPAVIMQVERFVIEKLAG